MSYGSLAVGLLEKTLSKTKDMSRYLLEIVHQLRRDNIAVVMSLDTTKTDLNNINLPHIIDGEVRSLTILSVGGGLFIQTSISDAFEVFEGDRISDEIIELLRWKGSGLAGTATVRLTGLRT